MKTVRERSPRALLIGGVVATLILSGLSLMAVTALGGGSTPGGVPLFGASCKVPNFSGSVVNVALTNMGGPMVGGSNGMMSGGAMRLSADRATVRHGTVSFLATNRGSIAHELIVLPIPKLQIAGTRPSGGDAKIDEAGSLGEASTTCGRGAGQGVLPGTSSWVSVTLQPGRYELVCNFSGHYDAGMYTQLTVS